jgi:ankyrin repeat protein
MVCYRPPIKRFDVGRNMNRLKVAAGAIALSLIGAPAAAQVTSGSDGATFVDAVRKGDAQKAIDLLRARATVVNARDDKGETGLIAAIIKRDDEWSYYLLQQGADPNLATFSGDTPLITAARVGYVDMVGELIARRVRVNAANKMGETALIIAVQQRAAPIVELLLAYGADPDRSDSAAGLSARDYAKRDPRGRDVLKLIEARKPATAAAGPAKS